MFRNILFQYSNTATEVKALSCTIELANYSGANITVLANYESVPKMFHQYETTLKDGLEASIKQKIKEAFAISGVAESSVVVQIKVCASDHPFLNTVKETLANHFDLVTKELIKGGHQNTICSADMSLLRKCPTPVFLFHEKCKPISQSKIYSALKVEAEMDSTDEMQSNYLFQIGRYLSGITKTQTHIVSCYDTAAFELVNTLSLSRLEPDIISDAVRTLKNTHYMLVNKLITRHKVTDIQFKQLNGLPSEQIPKFVAKEKVDCLIIGTTSKSNIAGYLMGSISEDVIKASNCSIFAIKPPGFNSPISLC